MANNLCLTRFSHSFHAPLTASQAVLVTQCKTHSSVSYRRKVKALVAYLQRRATHLGVPTRVFLSRCNWAAILVCPRWDATHLGVPTRVSRSGCNWASLIQTNLWVLQAVLARQQWATTACTPLSIVPVVSLWIGRDSPVKCTRPKYRLTTLKMLLTKQNARDACKCCKGYRERVREKALWACLLWVLQAAALVCLQSVSL